LKEQAAIAAMEQLPGSDATAEALLLFADTGIAKQPAIVDQHADLVSTGICCANLKWRDLPNRSHRKNCCVGRGQRRSQSGIQNYERLGLCRASDDDRAKNVPTHRVSAVASAL
jgi:hypothetical protein